MFSSLIKTGIGHSGMGLSAVQLEVTSITATLLQLYIAEVPFYCREFLQERFFVWPFEISHDISTKFHFGDELLPAISREQRP